MSNSDNEWEDSDDEWVESGSNVVTNTPNESEDFFNTTETITWDNVLSKHGKYEAMGENIKLGNFLSVDGIKTLYRCEPVEKKYPEIMFNGELTQYKHVLLTMALFHADCEHELIRVPDLKDKYTDLKNAGGVVDLSNETYVHRTEYGLWINGKQPRSIRFKKKATDPITKSDCAFRVGCAFKFVTNTAEPRQIIVATPFENGVLLKDKAIRSEPFFVKSKRQEKDQSRPTKRRKKEIEVQKILTDINTVNVQKTKLQSAKGRLEYQISVIEHFFANTGLKIAHMENGPAKIALQHAFRSVGSKKQSVTL